MFYGIRMLAFRILPGMRARAFLLVGWLECFRRNELPTTIEQAYDLGKNPELFSAEKAHHILKGRICLSLLVTKLK